MVDWCVGIGVVGCVLAFPVVLVLAARALNKYTMGRCKSKNRLDGKVVLITGCNAGIGKETAKVLAHRGARVIMACRNLQKAEDVANKIRDETPLAKVVVMRLDLCSLTSIRNFAHEVLKNEKKIDILLNNAGISGGKFKLTEDGFEEVYQANYLGPFYLTELLMPLLKKSAPARILNVGSGAYFYGQINPATFHEDVRTHKASSFFRYGNSKLAMLMWTRGMAKELQNSGVTINCIHPGVVLTKIASQSLNMSNLFFRTNIAIFGRTTTEGAQTLLHLCLDPVGDEKSGKFWTECRPTWTIKANDPVSNKELLDVTRKSLGLLA